MKIQAYHTPDILFSILFYSSRCRATNGAHVGQIAQLQVRDIIKHIDDALFPRHANKRDGCIGAREEEFFSQPEHLGGISVDHAAMCEDQHPLPYMPTCNFVIASTTRVRKARDGSLPGTSSQWPVEPAIRTISTWRAVSAFVNASRSSPSLTAGIGRTSPRVISLIFSTIYRDSPAYSMSGTAVSWQRRSGLL